jgi:hypothetical protein
MPNCLCCERRVASKVGFDCKTEDGKLHNILVNKEYLNDSALKTALLEHGVDCPSFLAKGKQGFGVNLLPHHHVQTVETATDYKKKLFESHNFKPQSQEVKEKINLKVWGGWIIASFSLALYITTLILGVT